MHLHYFHHSCAIKTAVNAVDEKASHYHVLPLLKADKNKHKEAALFFLDSYC